MPPSMVTVVPVSDPARGLATKTIKSATSCAELKAELATFARIRRETRRNVQVRG
jgi:hypothetical protein